MGFSKEDGLISKTKSIVLSLRSVIFGSSRLPSPMQIQNECTAYKRLKLPGLKTLIYSPQTPQTHSNPLIIHSCAIPLSHFEALSTHSSSCSSWSSGMDDMLGTESGVYMSPNQLQMPELSRANGKQKRERAMKREYPPAIPSLARTGNLPGRMPWILPWILRRHYINGRLILKEERVKHYEYFEAYRENGRLILDLVSLDDTITCCHAVYEKKDGQVFREESEKVEPEADEDNGYVYQGSIKISSAFQSLNSVMGMEDMKIQASA